MSDLISDSCTLMMSERLERRQEPLEIHVIRQAALALGLQNPRPHFPSFPPALYSSARALSARVRLQRTSILIVRRDEADFFNQRCQIFASW